jgi:hypothetical protein
MAGVAVRPVHDEVGESFVDAGLHDFNTLQVTWDLTYSIHYLVRWADRDAWTIDRKFYPN